MTYDVLKCMRTTCLSPLIGRWCRLRLRDALGRNIYVHWMYMNAFKVSWHAYIQKASLWIFSTIYLHMLPHIVHLLSTNPYSILISRWRVCSGHWRYSTPSWWTCLEDPILVCPQVLCWRILTLVFVFSIPKTLLHFIYKSYCNCSDRGEPPWRHGRIRPWRGLIQVSFYIHHGIMYLK